MEDCIDSFADDDFLFVKQRRKAFFDAPNVEINVNESEHVPMQVDLPNSFFSSGLSCLETNFTLKIKKTNDKVIMPTYHNDCAAGFDLYLNEDLVLLPLEQKLVGSGLCFEIPNGHYGQIAEKSSIALAGISIHGGIIDCDYRGEVRILLHNRTSSTYRAQRGAKIAQMIIIPYRSCKLVETNDLSTTDRGQRGFGGKDVSKL